MKKRVGLVASIFVTVLLIVLMVGFVSANPFSDFFNNLFSGPQFSPADTTNLAAYYNFDADAKDQTTNGNNGVVSGTTLVSSKFGNAYSFNGANNFISATNNGLLLTGDISVSAWIKLSSTGIDQKIVGLQDGKSGGYKFGVFTNNKVEFEIRNSGNTPYLNRNVAGGTVLQKGVWYHVVGVYSDSGNYIKTYVNGVSERSYTTSGVLGKSTGNLYIGRNSYSSGYYFNGQIDDLRIYNRALTATEVKELYNYVPVTTVCGNGVIEIGEICDSNTEPCPFGLYSGTKTCNAQCTGFDSCISKEKCGDGIVNGPEQCDDNNINNGDGCSDSCQTEVTTNQTQSCTDSDGISDQREISEATTKSIAGLDVYVVNADETNSDLKAEIQVSIPGMVYTQDAPYNSSNNIILTNSQPSASVLLNGIDYTIILVTASDSAATIRVSSEKNYYVKGSATGLTDSGQNVHIVNDGCIANVEINNDWLREGYCNSNIATFNDYKCPNGCQDGACLQEITNGTTQLVDGCNLLSDDVIGKIVSIEKSNGTVVKQEGNKIFRGQYVVVPSPSGGSIWKLVSIYNDTTSASGSEVEFRDIISTQEVSAKTTNWGWGNIDFGGQSYIFTFSDNKYVEGDEYVTLNFLQTSTNQLMNFENCELSGICAKLISKVKTPSSFEDLEVKYELRGNGSWMGDWYVNGVPKSYINYNAGWSTFYKDKYYYLSYQIMVFDDTTFDSKTLLDQFTSYKVCKVQSFWSADNKENKVYICNYDVLTNKQSIGDGYSYDSRQVFWTQGNILVEAFVYNDKQLTNEEIAKLSQQKINDFIDNLINNNMEYVDWEYFQIDYPISRQIESAVSQCPSSIPSSECSASWNCKIEPAICPEYGYQKRICVDYSSCNQPKKEDQIYCSPGICSGCYVPRWLGYDNGDNTCIPYGIRLAHESVTSYADTISEGIYGDLGSSFSMELKVISDVTATMTIFQNNETFSTNYLYEGNIAEIIFPRDIIKGSLKIKVVDVVQGSGEKKGYIKFSLVEKSNAYCDIDGSIKQQKANIEGKDWPKCQNNYECESNVCSGGECLPVSQTIRKSGKILEFILSALCRLINPFNDEQYQQCIAGFK